MYKKLELQRQKGNFHAVKMSKTHFLFVRETGHKRENGSSSGCSSLINRPDLTWLMPMSETLLSNFSGNLCCHKKIMCKLLPNTNELESYLYEFPSLLSAIAMSGLQVFRKWAYIRQNRCLSYSAFAKIVQCDETKNVHIRSSTVLVLQFTGFKFWSIYFREYFRHKPVSSTDKILKRTGTIWHIGNNFHFHTHFPKTPIHSFSPPSPLGSTCQVSSSLICCI